MPITKHIVQGAAVFALLAFAAAPATAQDLPATGPTDLQLPDGPPPVPDAPPPSGKPCKGKKGKAKRRCLRRMAPAPGPVARSSSSGPRYLLGSTDCHTTPFAGTTTQQPLVTAADGDPGVDQQFVRIETFRFKWNGTAWAYETTIDSAWAYATDRAWSTYYYNNGRWDSRGSFGTGVSSGYYAMAQRITWIPTKSAPANYGVFVWSPLAQNGRAVGYCTF